MSTQGEAQIREASAVHAEITDGLEYFVGRGEHRDPVEAAVAPQLQVATTRHQDGDDVKPSGAVEGPAPARRFITAPQPSKSSTPAREAVDARVRSCPSTYMSRGERLVWRHEAGRNVSVPATTQLTRKKGGGE